VPAGAPLHMPSLNVPLLIWCGFVAAVGGFAVYLARRGRRWRAVKELWAAWVYPTVLIAADMWCRSRVTPDPSLDAEFEHDPRPPMPDMVESHHFAPSSPPESPT
jgi:hypothetical protein